MEIVTSEPYQSNSDNDDSPLGRYCQICVPPPPTEPDEILIRFYLQTLSRELLPKERVAICLRQIVPGQQTVEIRIDPAKHSAHYANLLTCGRLWFCPICASRISEKRAEELTTATYQWRQSGGFVVMLTYTLQHNVKSTLHDVLHALREAHRKFKSGSPFQKIVARYGWSGSVCALEVTHGLNGWHTHLHELVFLTPLSDDSLKAFEAACKRRWIDSLAAFSAFATWEHGLDLKIGDSHVHEYIAKYGRLPAHPSWGVEREVTKAVIKRGKAEGRTPFQILLDYGEGCAADKFLFQEYASEFKGRKQLVWSRGLRDMLKMSAEENDAQLAEKLPIEYETLATISKPTWKSILALPSDERGHILTVASKGDKSALARYLNMMGIAFIA